MPSFDLRGIKTGRYINTDGAVTYGPAHKIGDAMQCTLELRFAEGRLYAESTLAEYIKLAVGGTIGIGVKYIPNDAQKLLFDMKAADKTVNSAEIKGLKYTTKDIANYVGVGFYAPDKFDGVTKYTCVFVARTLLGPPSMTFQTKGESITFQTPTSAGEFLADHSPEQNLLIVSVADTEDDAIAWVDSWFETP